MTPVIPAQALQQHLAILGKTGSGKTSTAKLAVEQVAGDDARVIVLDPIKSDWWGLTSSADGKRPGLPFHILGGPHGHVPLHAAAGKAIGELVGRGDLRQAIIDMADFEPGGQLRFFVDFAPALLRSMRGVVYLVIEEAHLFAPKERSGMGSEQLAIHWAKTIATAGRSKGIRLMVLSQRTQALHNAVLGSCETIIAHRFTAPADREPILKWLKANAEDEIYSEVQDSISSLKTGEGWLCSGEAKIFERRMFPRIRTYDNSATPTDDDQRRAVATAPVDTEALRAILGDAVKEAEENDPKQLRARVKDLERELDRRDRLPQDVGNAFLEEAEQRGYERGVETGRSELARGIAATFDRLDTLAKGLAETVEGARLEAQKLAIPAMLKRAVYTPPQAAPARAPTRTPAPAPSSRPRPSTGALPAMPRAILTTLAQHREGMAKGTILVHTGYRSSGPVSKCFAELSRDGLVETVDRASLRITAQGLRILGDFEPLPTGAALRDQLLNGSKLSGMEKAILAVLFKAHPHTIAKGEILEATGYASSGPTSKAFAHLVALGYAEKSGRGGLRASEVLYTD